MKNLFNLFNDRNTIKLFDNHDFQARSVSGLSLQHELHINKLQAQ
jgi:hypothetical protein